jgi:hypothetical protein
MGFLLRKFMLLVLGTLLAVTILFGVATVQPSQQHVAHAGTNGQVIGFGCGPDKLWDAYVYGYNQDGNYTTWHQNAGGATHFTTSGYWWKGPLHIDVWDSSYNGGTWLHRDYTIPTVWSGGVYELSC